MKTRRNVVLTLCLLAAASLTGPFAGSDAKPIAEPARIEIQVAPGSAAPGSESRVTLRLTPQSGIKINRYPNIKLKVDAQPGLVAAAEVAVGSSQAPPPDRIETNYFTTVDPVELPLRVDPEATAGPHDVRAQLTYYYCVAASGFCAPKRVPVTIPLTVR